MTINEFIEKFTTFKPTPMQQYVMEKLSEIRPGEKVLYGGRRSGKRMLNDEFMCAKLCNMEKGETFGIATPRGIYTFKCGGIIKL